MLFLATAPLQLLADATAASNAMKAFLAPVMTAVIALASVSVVFFLVQGGIQYMTSSGSPDKLEHAKKIIKNALIGLVLVIAAATLTAILNHAYSSSGATGGQSLPQLVAIEPKNPSGGVVQAIIDSIIGVLKNIMETVAAPFLNALEYFTDGTPLMADNSGVANLWLGMVGIADALFVLVVALLGFHVMSYSSFGFDEIEFKHLLPRIGLMFLLLNSSIFIIDGVISLSNGMIHALNAGFPTLSVWKSLEGVVDKSSGIGLAGLLLMLVFIILTTMLLVYYVLRLVVLYIGAVLSPLIALIWLVPGYRDFAENAAKTYVGTIFVLFVHVVILQLVASIFTGMTAASQEHVLNPLMSIVVGIATILALLKTQQVMLQLSMMGSGVRTAKSAVGTIVNAVRGFSDKRTIVAQQHEDKFPRKGVNRNSTISLPQNPPKNPPASTSSARSKTHATGQTKPAPKYYSDTPKVVDEDYPSSARTKKASPKPRSRKKS